MRSTRRIITKIPVKRWTIPGRVLYGFLPLLLAAAACAPVSAQDPASPATAGLPQLDQLGDGWNTLRPGGETRCAYGDDFEFYARVADTARLMVFLYGGGGCWDAETCDPERDGIFISTIEPGRHPMRLSGIFDLDHPDNPVANYSMVAVPVCTGDAYLGERDVAYTLQTERGEAREFTIHHRGQTNAMVALDWIRENITAPQEIFVAGSSAGAVAAPFYASLLAQHYPAARVSGLGDAAGSWGSAMLPGADPARWGVPETLRRHPGWEGFDSDAGIEHLYATAAHSAPNLRLYQFDNAYDDAQRFYLNLAGAEAGHTDVLRNIRTNRRVIREQVPGFRSFTAGGYSHTILTVATFYYVHTDGHRVRDWVATIVTGGSVSSVDCTDECLRPGLNYDDQDLRIVERVLEILSAPGAWNPRDAPGACPPQPEHYSLRCAGVQAAKEVTGRTPAGVSNVPAAMWDVIFTITARLPDGERGDPLRRYNNHPHRTASDVIALLEEVVDRIRHRLSEHR